MENAIVTALTTPAPRATINIDFKALHPISTEPWHKQNSVRVYTPEEFKAKFVSMDPNEASRTKVYDLLITFREGSHLKKQTEHEISVTELCELPDKERDKRIEHFYKQLREALPPTKNLLLPYTTNREKRKSILMSRLSRIYDNLDSDRKRAAYKCIFATHKDEKRKISFPYFFEILAVPFADPTAANNGVEFIGAVNYSISPKANSNLFEGDYNRYFNTDYDSDRVKNIRDVLAAFGFHTYAVDSAKIPCVIIANLVTPRRDPHGFDKSSIDVTPFTGTIVQAAKRLAGDISSYRGRHITFKTPAERRSAKPESNKKGALERVLTRYLQENYDLPLEPIRSR